MIVLICGDRNWKARGPVRALILSLSKSDTIILGGARGADRIAKEEGKKRRIRVLTFNADWHRYGRGAGPRRNTIMLYRGKPDRVVAFHDDLRKSKGTKDMLEKALAAGVPCELRDSRGGRRRLTGPF